MEVKFKFKEITHTEKSRIIEDKKRCLAIGGLYNELAEQLVLDLIERFYNDDPEKRYITIKDFLSYGIGNVLYTQFDINAFIASVHRIAVKHDFVIVSLPCIDMGDYDPCCITITDYKFEAVPLYVPDIQ